MLEEVANLPPELYSLLVLGVIAFDGVLLYMIGQPLIAPSGKVKLWQGDHDSPEHSYHIADWYSFGHFTIGLVSVYVFLWIAPQLLIKTQLVLATVIMVLWEFFENTDYGIEHFRDRSFYSDYRGDTVVNSVSDIVFFIIGFSSSIFFPVWFVIFIIILVESIMFFYIQDNVTLGIVKFIFPVKYLRNWRENK